MAITYKQLYQGKPTDTATAVVSGETGKVKIITDVFRFENAGGTPTLTWYHDDDGTTYDGTTQIYSEAFTANEVKSPMSVRIAIAAAGKFALKNSTTQQTTVTIYGLEIT